MHSVGINQKCNYTFMHQETAKGSLVFKSSWHLSTKHGRGSTLSITEHQLIKKGSCEYRFL